MQKASSLSGGGGGGGGGSAPSGSSLKKGLGFVPTTYCKAGRDSIQELLQSAPPTYGALGCYSSSCGEERSSEATIPLFQLSPETLQQESARDALIRSFGIALMKVGSLGVEIGEVESQLARLYQEMGRYFLQPLDKKLQDWCDKPTRGGFVPMGKECFPLIWSTDNKESLFLTPNSRKFAGVSNQLLALVQPLQQRMERAARTLMEMIADFLNLQGKGLESFYDYRSLLSLNHYTKGYLNGDPNLTWEAAKQPHNILTLSAMGSIPGIEIGNKQGHWHSVRVPKGYLIASAGQYLKHITAGLIDSPVQRVVHPGGKYQRFERFSITYQIFWDDDYLLEPFANCLDYLLSNNPTTSRDQLIKKYPTMTIKEFTKK